MILHTLTSAVGTQAFSQCVAQLRSDDTLLLMGNGVYAALAASPAAGQLQQCGAALYVLAEDARAAGVLNQLAANFETVDYPGFVELSERCPRQLAWY